MTLKAPSRDCAYVAGQKSLLPASSSFSIRVKINLAQGHKLLLVREISRRRRVSNK